ncbi:MAG: M20/M25/M40 family metallo-hydrolase [Alphaproteobacteria bacterium]|nr:M20/M25/M40 family metallo-hydrolase [Alphaproteobacteria bacterium]
MLAAGRIEGHRVDEESVLTGLSLAKELLSPKKLGRHADGKQGLSRLGYEAQECEAVGMVLEQGEKLGLELYEDVAANAFLVFPGKDRHKPVLLMGSHLDSVKQGGLYDGTTGVVVPLAAIKALQEEGAVPPQDVAVAIWRCEESPNFKQFGVGSGMATAALPTSVLEKTNLKGVSLKDSLVQAYSSSKGRHDADLLFLEERLKARDPILPVGHIAHAVEFHIEQADTLRRNDKSLGIVSAIRGNVRFPSVEFFGKSQHTGGGFQGDRQDASLMLGAFMGQVMSQAEKIGAKKDLVHSFPLIGQPNDNSTTTPNYVAVAFEARSVDAKALDKMASTVEAAANNAVAKHGGEVTVGPMNRTEPVFMDVSVQKLLRGHARRLGLSTYDMVSGAGHDIMRLQNAGVASALVLMRHSGKSHNPMEDLCLQKDPFVPDSDVGAAVRLAASFMMKPGASSRTREGSFTKELCENRAREIFGERHSFFPSLVA